MRSELPLAVTSYPQTCQSPKTWDARLMMFHDVMMGNACLIVTATCYFINLDRFSKEPGNSLFWHRVLQDSVEVIDVAVAGDTFFRATCTLTDCLKTTFQHRITINRMSSRECMPLYIISSGHWHHCSKTIVSFAYALPIICFRSPHRGYEIAKGNRI